jgi:hypothetical protein
MEQVLFEYFSAWNSLQRKQLASLKSAAPDYEPIGFLRAVKKSKMKP